MQAMRGVDLAPREVLPSGIAPLDAILPHGGIPRARLSEISGRRSSGKRTLATALCSHAISCGEQVAWIDAHKHGRSGGFYPLPALEFGAPLEQLLLVRVSADDPRHALKAADLLLAAGGAVSLLVIDLPPHALHQPTAQLARLQRGAEKSGATLLFITERPTPSASLGTFIALQLAVRRKASLAHLEVQIIKSKLGKMACGGEVALNEPHSLHLHTTL